jgi:hypothetical protein
MSYFVTFMSFIVNRLPAQPVITFFNYFFTVGGTLLYAGRKSNPNTNDPDSTLNHD